MTLLMLWKERFFWLISQEGCDVKCKVIKSDFLNKEIYSNLQKGVAKLVKYLSGIFSCKVNIKIFAPKNPKGFFSKLSYNKFMPVE